MVAKPVRKRGLGTSWTSNRLIRPSAIDWIDLLLCVVVHMLYFDRETWSLGSQVNDILGPFQTDPCTRMFPVIQHATVDRCVSQTNVQKSVVNRFANYFRARSY